MIYKFREWDKINQKMTDADSLAFEEFEPLVMQLNYDTSLVLMQYTRLKR